MILDNVATRSFKEYRQVLTPAGVYVPNSGHAGFGFVFKAFLLSMLLRKQKSPFMAIPNNKHLGNLKNLVESGRLKTVIDRTYPLEKNPEAMEYIGEGHARGKVVITISQ